MNKSKLIIVGSGALGEQILHITNSQKLYTVVGFVDDFEIKGVFKYGLPILGKLQDLDSLLKNGIANFVVLGIGYNHMSQRAKIFKTLFDKYDMATIIDPSANIDSSVLIGQGAVIYPGVILGKNVVVKENVLINLGSIVSHDSVIGINTIMSPGCKVAGFVKVGMDCVLGIGTVIIDNIDIIKDTVTGGGAVVIKNLVEPGTYVGNPAKRIIKK